MAIQHLLTVWSIRLALLLLSLVVLVRVRRFGHGQWAHDCLAATREAGNGEAGNGEAAGEAGHGRGGGWKVWRLIWLIGCLLAVVHVIAVFGYVMHWSHQAAVADTAQRTRQLIGITFGGGVYFNYLFLIVWICDAAWWCGWPQRYLRRSWLWDLLLIGYLWFIAFNAAVVFETGIIRWLGLLATSTLVVVGIQAWVARNTIR